MPEELAIERWIDVQEVNSRLLAYLPNVVAALALVLGAWLVVRLTRKPLRLALRRADFAPALVHLLVDNLYRYLVLALGLIMAAGQLGVNLTAALGTLGIAGVAVGFAAQDSLANTIAGFMIFWDKPFRVGDYITAGDEKLYGRVEDITMRTTRIRKRDNTYVIIPNQDVIDQALVNHSMNGDTRVDVSIGIAYKEDVQRAREVLLEATRDQDGVLEEPAPAVTVTELAGSSVNLSLRVWIGDAADERPIRHRCLELGKAALDDAGIEIPFPHLQLFVDDVKEPVWEGLSRLPALRAGDPSQRGDGGGDA